MKIAVLSITLVGLIAGGLLIMNRSLQSARAEEERERAQFASLELELRAMREAQSREAENSKRLQARVAKLEAVGIASAKAASGGKGGPQSSKAAQSEAPAKSAPEDGAAREAKVAEALEKLAGEELSEGKRQEVWSALRAEGLLDDAVAALEARAKEEPRNPDRHADLGNAYLQKTMAAAEGEKGRWAIKSDQAFDQALALDERHWGARFTKAASLAFWPPLFGKQAEAMKNFEVLRQQQEEGPPQPKFSATYLLLGNLYQNGGNAAKAQEVWKKGAELYPSDPELAKKVETPKEN